jgi:septum formation protein
MRAMKLAARGTFILASASPRRIEMLTEWGLSFKIVSSGADESLCSGETPQRHVGRISANKALAVAETCPDAWVLGADTIVSVDSRILGKPDGKEEAEKMIRLLSGREHDVFTGFTIVRKSEAIFAQDVVRSSVVFREISDEEINWYVCSGEPYDKAGGYGIQKKGGLFVREIRGSHSNVIGLPLCEVFDALKKLGAVYFTEE